LRRSCVAPASRLKPRDGASILQNMGTNVRKEGDENIDGRS